MIDITAAVIREKAGDWSIETLQLDEPRDDEILVRIVGVGICHTDISIRNQYLPVPLPAVLGHEGAGIVERIGSNVNHLVPGDHVVLAPMSCGGCINCQTGMPMYCDQFIPLNIGMCRPDGSPTIFENRKPVAAAFFGQSSFASFALAHQRSAVKVDTDLPLELLGPLGCGIQTGAGTVIEALRPQAGSSIAIFGAGPVGLSAIMAAKLVGCGTIIAVDRWENRLQLASELGATHTVLAQQADLGAAIRSATAGRGLQYAIDTTANPTIIRQAADALAPTGVCAILGLAPFGTEVAFDINMLGGGRTVRGVIEGEVVPALFIPTLIDLWQQGRFPFDRMIRTYDFQNINQAVADTLSGQTLKAVLRFP